MVVMMIWPLRLYAGRSEEGWPESFPVKDNVNGGGNNQLVDWFSTFPPDYILEPQAIRCCLNSTTPLSL